MWIKSLKLEGKNPSSESAFGRSEVAKGLKKPCELGFVKHVCICKRKIPIKYTHKLINIIYLARSIFVLIWHCIAHIFQFRGKQDFTEAKCATSTTVAIS